MTTLPNAQEVMKTLWLGPDWVPMPEVVDMVNLRRQSIHSSCVVKGVVRAKQDEASPSTLILRDDVWYVYTTRRAFVESGKPTRYVNLVDREVFPKSCRGMDGYKLSSWATLHRPDLMVSTFEPPAWLSREVPRGASESVEDLLSMETLQGRMGRLETLVGTLLAVNGHEPTWTAFNDVDCEALFTQAVEALRDDHPQLAHWNQVLSRLGSDHVAQLAGWARRHPEAVEHHWGSPLNSPAYVVLLDLAKRNESLARQLPGIMVQGSRNFMLYRAVDRTRAHIHELVRFQLSSDLLLEPDHGRYLPAPLTRTDRFILGYLTSSD